MIYDPCPFCDGTGERLVVKKHGQSGRSIPATELCMCSRSKFISNQYPMLDYLKSEYLPIEDVEKTLIFDHNNLVKSPNYIIRGTQKCFHLHVKSIMMKYRFHSLHISMHLSTSIGVIHKFHVPQEDGIAPHLSSTDAFDLLIIMFGDKEENKALKAGMAQVIYNRKDQRPTWIYCPEQALSLCPKEYSDDLGSLVKSYKIIDLKCANDTGVVITKSQNSAADFSPGAQA